MNRTIKFRGKCTFSGEWICGYLVVVPHGAHRIYFKPFDDATSNTWLEVDPSTVGQFTGPLDKDGKEIYEGDIYKRILDKSNRHKKDHEWADYWLVSWIKTDCCFTTTCIGNNEDGKFVKEDGWASKTNPYSKRFDEFDQYIGNIHDNPELLK